MVLESERCLFGRQENPIQNDSKKVDKRT